MGGEKRERRDGEGREEGLAPLPSRT